MLQRGIAATDRVDDEADREALERYYRQRIREIRKDESPFTGRRGFVPLDELRRLADEREARRRAQRS